MENKYYFDTCALVELYDKRVDFFEMIIEKMSNEKIYVSKIVEEELTGKYVNYIHNDELHLSGGLDTSIIYNYIDEVKQFGSQLSGLGIDTEIEKVINQLGGLELDVIKNAEKQFKKKLKEVKDERKKVFSNTPFPYELIDFSYKDRIDCIDEATRRLKNGIPPGYLDYQQKDRRFHEFNDFYIWKSILEHVKKSNEDAIYYYVTNDEKDCNNPVDKLYMEKEFEEYTGSKISLINSEEFLEKIGYDSIKCEDYLETINEILYKDFTDEVIVNKLFVDTNLSQRICMDYDIKFTVNKKELELESGEFYSLNLIKFKSRLNINLSLLFQTEDIKGFNISLEFDLFYDKDKNKITKISEVEVIWHGKKEITDKLINESYYKKHNSIEFFKKNKRNIYKNMREEIFVRDNFSCCICGENASTNPDVSLEIDHIIPLRYGGESTPENLQTVCRSCNFTKPNYKIKIMK